jgi:predicted nucleic acid-binding protein
MEALCLMVNRPGSLFLTDDAAARLAAQQLGYSVHGTIGILIRAVRRNQLTALEVINRLRSIPDQSSLFIRVSLLDEILYQLEEEFNLR